eukprot:8911926-Alexandrium_andersonii.AAC.1
MSHVALPRHFLASDIRGPRAVELHCPCPAYAPPPCPHAFLVGLAAAHMLCNFTMASLLLLSLCVLVLSQVHLLSHVAMSPQCATA